MTTEATPGALGSNDQLGLAPERALWDAMGCVADDEVCLQMLSAHIAAAVAAERDCRTCAHWTPHHRADVMHCSSPLRCVAGSAHKRQGLVQFWEAAPVDAGF